jgi:phage terminase small subunit
MGRNRQPTAILDARGAFIANPSRERPDEPTSDQPLGDPPAYLDPEQQDIWREIAGQALPGVVLQSDRTAFELLVRLTDLMRRGLLLKSSEMTTLISLCSRFAMTPADRSKVAVEKPKESKLAQFLSTRLQATVPNETLQ